MCVNIYKIIKPHTHIPTVERSTVAILHPLHPDLSRIVYKCAIPVMYGIAYQRKVWVG